MSTPETIRAYALSIVADVAECTESDLAADESKDTAATIARVETMLGQFAAEVQKDEELNVEIEHDGYTWSASASRGRWLEPGQEALVPKTAVRHGEWSKPATVKETP